MSRPRMLWHLVRADFLERVRRYSFLITMGFSVYLGYLVYSGKLTMQLDQYGGVNNAAWVGALMALVGSVWIPLVGFYVVKNTIERDRETRVGQILASTPMSKGFYTLGKALSNLAVLGLMVVILGAAAVVIQVAAHPHGPFELATLLAPILLFGLSSVALTAALAVLFESLPVLRGGVGNVLYFFLWTALVIAGVSGLDNNKPAPPPAAFRDSTGLAAVMGQMQSRVRAIDPEYKGGASFSVGGLMHPTKTFLWTGIEWTPEMLLSRVLQGGVAVLLALLAAVFFDRFDPARARGEKKGKHAERTTEKGGGTGASGVDSVASGLGSAQGTMTVGRLTLITRRTVRMRMAGLVMAELRLMLKGQRWWWYVVAAGLWVGCVASPLDAARGGVLPVAWMWPLLIWSQMGARETQRGVGLLVFSAPRAVPRQLLAVYGAGLLVALMAGSGLALRLVATGDGAGLAAWLAGAMFIPALALALGVATGSRKPFEALYTVWWYVGPLHHIQGIDFMGTSPQSSAAVVFAGAAVLLVITAYAARRARVAYA